MTQVPSVLDHMHIYSMCVCACLSVPVLASVGVHWDEQCFYGNGVCVILFGCVCDVCPPHVTQVKFSISQGF